MDPNRALTIRCAQVAHLSGPSGSLGRREGTQERIVKHELETAGLNQLVEVAFSELHALKYAFVGLGLCDQSLRVLNGSPGDVYTQHPPPRSC
jgi:hypothetical protein